MNASVPYEVSDEGAIPLVGVAKYKDCAYRHEQTTRRTRMRGRATVIHCHANSKGPKA